MAFCSLALAAALLMPQVGFDNLHLFAMSNLEYVKTPVRGVVIDHHGLGCSVFGEKANAAFAKANAADGEKGIVWIHPHYGPWAWMNAGAVRLTDRLVDLVLGHYGLPADTPVCSSGGSMGGQGAMVYAAQSRHSVKRVVVNCGVADLPYHYTERPDTPRTIAAAYAEAPDLEAEMRARSPLHLAEAGKLPKIAYVVFHSDRDTGVNKEKHGDRLVAALRAGGYDVEYHVSEGTGHTELRPELVKRYYAAIRETFGKQGE